MKLLASAAFGAVALATAMFASATPAEARTSFGIYVGGPGYNYHHRCDDYWYRRRHPRRCGYYDGYYNDYYGYYPYYYYNDYYYRPRFGHRHHRWGKHRRHWDGGHHRRHHGRHHRRHRNHW